MSRAILIPLQKTTKQLSPVIKELNLNNLRALIHLENGHTKELEHLPGGRVALKRALHETPMPEFVDDHRWAGVDLEDLEGETSRKGGDESAVRGVGSFFRRIEAS